MTLKPTLTLAGEKQPRWQQMALPLEHFGHRGQLDELVVVPGAALHHAALTATSAPPLHHLSYHLSITAVPSLYHEP